MSSDAPHESLGGRAQSDDVDSGHGFVLDTVEQESTTGGREIGRSRYVGITTSAEAIEQVIQRACDRLGEGALTQGVVASTKESIKLLFSIDTAEFPLIHEIVASHVEVSLPDGSKHLATVLAIPEMVSGVIEWRVGSLHNGVWTPLPETELGRALATQRTDKPEPVNTPSDSTTAQTDTSTYAPTRAAGPGIPRDWDDPRLETIRDILDRPRTSERLGIKLSIKPTRIWLDKLREVSAGRQIWHASFELAIFGRPRTPTLGTRLTQLNAAASQATLTYDGPSYPIEQLGSSIRHYLRQRDPLFYKSDVMLEYPSPSPAPYDVVSVETVRIKSIDDIIDKLQSLVDANTKGVR